MTDVTNQLSAQAAAFSHSEVQFIIGALRARERAILICGQDPSSTHVPDEALAACESASVRVLHIGHPLPSLLELQEMIGSAAGITGGFGVAPQAMAQRLLTSVPRQSVILAIDGADMLPRQSLYYLSQLSNALATDGPFLQIVFAAGPAIIEQLSHPDFETFRNCIVVFGDKDSEQEDDRLKSQAAQGRALQVVAPRSVQLPPHSATPRRPLYINGRVALRLTGTNVVAGILVIGCLLVIGYDAFLVRTGGQTQPSAPAVSADAPQDLAVAPYRPPPTSPDAREADQAIASLIDQFETAMARESPGAPPDGEAAKLADRIEMLAKRASPDGLLMVIALKDRIAARVIAALDAGRSEEALQLEQLLGRSGNSPSGAASTAVADIAGRGSKGEPSQREKTTDAEAIRPNDAGGPQAAGKTDQPIMFPDLVAPTAAPAATASQDKAAPAVSGDLPAFAPARVILNFPRNNIAAAERTAALRQALTAAKVEVVSLESADVHGSTPSIGYYFRTDRDAAVDVSRRVAPLLGRVEPVVLELRGKVPPPGTIEIAVPGRGAVSERVHRKHSNPNRHVKVSDVIKRILRSFSAGH